MHVIFSSQYLTISDDVWQPRGVSKGFWFSAQRQNSKALSVLLPDFWKLCFQKLLYYQCEDLNGISLKDFSLLSVSCFAVLFHKPLATQSAVLAAQILVLASHCTCVLLFLHPVINVLGLYGIPSIQISHFLSVSVPFLCLCVVVGMLSNKVCLHLISTLTN